MTVNSPAATHRQGGTLEKLTSSIVMIFWFAAGTEAGCVGATIP